jgi:hypothetical protein
VAEELRDDVPVAFPTVTLVAPWVRRFVAE